MTYDITTGQPSLGATERNGLYDKVVAPHYNTIMTAVRRQTFPGEDADDNLQDVLIILLQNVATIAALPPEQRLPWMLRAVRNKLTSIHRHTRFVNDALRYDDDDDTLRYDDDALRYDDDNDDDTLRYDDDDGSGHCSPQLVAGHYDSAGPFSPSSTPPLTIEREDYPATYDALMALSALQRRALLLESEGWTPADIMAELRLPASTAYSMLSRARKAVAEAVNVRQQKYWGKCL